MADEEKPKEPEEKEPPKEGPPKKEVEGLDSLLQETEFVKKTNERLNAIDTDVGKLGESFGSSIEKFGDAIKGLIKTNVETTTGISERMSRLEARINEVATAVTPVPGGGAPSAPGGGPPPSQAPPVGVPDPGGEPGTPARAEVLPVPAGKWWQNPRVVEMILDRISAGEKGGTRPAIDEVLGYIEKVDKIKASGRQDLMDSAKYFTELMKAMKGIPTEVAEKVPEKITPPPGTPTEEGGAGGGLTGEHLGTFLE